MVDSLIIFLRVEIHVALCFGKHVSLNQLVREKANVDSNPNSVDPNASSVPNIGVENDIDCKGYSPNHVSLYVFCILYSSFKKALGGSSTHFLALFQRKK